MSYREATLVSKAVFGSTDEQMHRSFLSIVNTQVVGQRTDTTDSRRIEISQFLHLAVVAYHQTQLNDANATSSNGGKGKGGEKESRNQENYNLPGDDELARALETDLETPTSRDSNIPNYMKPKSPNQSSPPSKDKKKMVPKTASATKSGKNTASAWAEEGEGWGEAGYYHDDNNSPGGNNRVPEYLDGAGIEDSVWKDRNADLNDPAFDQSRGERLDEFMDVLMESLGSLPDSIMGGVQEQLYQALDEKLNIAINESSPSANITSVDDFDDLIVSILSHDDFVNGMVSIRDSILESYGDEGVDDHTQ
jgi:hypothetical protein